MAFDTAEIVVAAEPDGGDGVLADKPYLIDSSTKFRVPYRFRAKAERSLITKRCFQTGAFTPEAGEALIRETAAWSFRRMASGQPRKKPMPSSSGKFPD